MRLSRLVTSTATLALVAIPAHAAAAADGCEEAAPDRPSTTGPAKATGGALQAVRAAAAPLRVDVAHGTRRLTALAKADGTLEVAAADVVLRPGCLAPPPSPPVAEPPAAPEAPTGSLEVQVGGVVIVADLEDVEVGGVVQVVDPTTLGPQDPRTEVGPDQPTDPAQPADPAPEPVDQDPPAPAPPTSLEPTVGPVTPVDPVAEAEPTGQAPAPEAPEDDTPGSGASVVGVQPPGLDDAREPEDGPEVEEPEAVDDEPDPEPAGERPAEDEPEPEPTDDIALEVVQPDPAPAEDEDSVDFDHYVLGLLAYLPDSEDEPDEVDPEVSPDDDVDEAPDRAPVDEPEPVFLTIGDDDPDDVPGPGVGTSAADATARSATATSASAVDATVSTPDPTGAADRDAEPLEPEPLILHIGEEDLEEPTRRDRGWRLPSVGTEVARRAMFGPITLGGSREQFGPGDVSFA